jgi:hypothetical protein
MTLTPEQFNKIAFKTDLDRVEEKINNITDPIRLLVDSMDAQR